MSTSSVYERYFGLSEPPFSITPDPRFVYLSQAHREALEHLKQGAQGGANGFVLLTGDVGTGKTTICRMFLEQVPPKTEVALILNPVLTLNEFLQTICDELDLVVEGDRKSNKNLIDHLNRFLLQVYSVGQKTILIVDEAQNLTHELLEQIRLLTNLETNTDKLLQIFLIGQPELRGMLSRPDMQQVSQRITSRYHLGPLDKTDTEAYILKRLDVAGTQSIDFTSSALRRVFGFSKGVPRLINVLCDKALLSAYESSTDRVDGRIVRDAERRVQGNLQSKGSGWTKVAAGAGAFALLAGITVGALNWFGIGFNPDESVQTASEPVVEAPSPVVAAAPPIDLPATASTADEATERLPAKTDAQPTTVAAVPVPAPPGSSMPQDALGDALSESTPEALTVAEATTPLGYEGVSADQEVAPESQQIGDIASATPVTTQATQTLGDGIEVDVADTRQNVTAAEPAKDPLSTETQPASADTSGDLPQGPDAVVGIDQPTMPADTQDQGDELRGELAITESVPPTSGEIDQRVTFVPQPDRGTESNTADPASETIEKADAPGDQMAALTAFPAETKKPEAAVAAGQASLTESTTQEATALPTEQTASYSPAAKEQKNTAVARTQARRNTARPVQTLTEYTRQYAERKLLSLWGIEKGVAPGAAFCDGARVAGLNCLEEQTGLSGLYLYNRPAIIQMDVGETPSFAVVMKASPESVTLNVVGREHTIPASTLPTVWGGNFLLLWKGNDVFDGIISQGESGQPVAWLRESIDLIEGTQTSGSAFDTNLARRVRQFQENAGLIPDGIVGPRTFMVLQNRLAELDKAQ